MFKIIEKQVNIAKQIKQHILDGKKNIILQAPTGSGKSGIAYNLHRLFNVKSYILMHQKILQDQYEDLLGDEALVIKGKENYDCILMQGVNAKNAPCQSGGGISLCHKRNECEYFIKKSRFKSDPCVITNYQLILSLLSVPSIDVKRNIAIYDECHNLENIITDYKKITVQESDVILYNNLLESLYKYDDYVELESYLKKLIIILRNFDIKNYEKSFIDYFDNVLYCLQKMTFLTDENTVNEMYNSRRTLLTKLNKVYNHLNNLNGKWNAYLSEENKKNYVFDGDTKTGTYELTPIDISNLTENIFNTISDFKIFMSATITNVEYFKKIMSLKEEETVFIDIPSEFPLKNRQVYMDGNLNVNYESINNVESDTFQALMYKIVKICALHANNSENGVIATPSYKLAYTIKNILEETLNELGYKVLFNEDSANKIDIFKEFTKKDNIKKILISPSFSEGVNFNDHIARFVIIPKMMFMGINSNYVKQKMQLNKEWYELSSINSIIQISGRVVRHKEDYGKTYILDSNTKRLIKKYMYELPRYFVQAIKELEIK